MPKPKIHPSARFWPGLPQLWVRGSWVGLAVAVGFTALANVLLLATCVFHQWLSSNTKLAGLGLMAVLWLGSWWHSRQWCRSEGSLGSSADGTKSEQRDEQQNRLFSEAQRLYLQNDWVRTEQLLLKLLKQDARDIESRLMLATLWHHQGRKAEALRQLDRLERLEAAQEWQLEINTLRGKLTPVDEVEELASEETNRRLAA